MTKNFTLFDWHSPFLPALVDYICEQTDNNPGLSIIILPHDRPRRYLIDLLRKSEKIKKPALLPHMFTIKEVIGLFCAQNTNILQNASLLDQVFLLYKAVQHVAHHEGSSLGQHFAHMDLARFLPWGTRLATLFEEYMLEDIEVKAIEHVEGEVSAQAAALLSFLGQIHNRYLKLLHKEMWTSQGLNALLASKEDHIPSLIDTKNIENRHTFIAGFFELHRTENIILKKLWQNGAHICLHTDPNIVHSSNSRSLLQENAHWSCQSHAKWIRNWQAKSQIYMQSEPRKPRMHFVSGYDLHSQLLSAKEILNEKNNTQSTAIVLTTPGLLMPMLHHLPEQDFNVSMGYPLNKSALFALIDAITNLHKNSRQKNTTNTTQGNTYYWRSLLHCIRHPYIQMLKTLPAQGEFDNHNAQSIRHIWHSMEKILRRSSRFVCPEKLLQDSLKQIEHTNQEQIDLIDDVLKAILENFASINTTQSLAQALMNLCQILLNYGYDIWQNSPLDAEALYRLVQNIIPSLKGSALAHEVMPSSTLFLLLQHLMQDERVPFEADPITGLQVLGLLETRLLHFEQVIIIDATDDVIPGFAAQDPLLPDALRHMLGLPDSTKREQNIAYNLYRLLAASNNVHFFWQEGTNNSSLFDGKKSRSRFIDTAIWQEEQELGYIIKNNDHPLKTVPCMVSPISRKSYAINVNKILQEKILLKLNSGIAPTSLDTYMHCPQRFAWQYIYNLAPLEEVNEVYDPLEVGRLLHQVLYDIYAPFKGTDVYAANIDMQLVDKHFQECLAKFELNLSPDSLIMLNLAGPMRLKRFLQNQPPLTHILALEQNLSVPIMQSNMHNNMSLKLNGILDRVDLRHINKQGRSIVLDYKTGKLQRIKREVWEDNNLWQELSSWKPQLNNGNDLLKEISNSFNSIQLPCYLLLCANNFKVPVTDAAWVNLAENGEEVFLFGEDMDEHLREQIISEQIPLLLKFILKHMSVATSLEPHEGEHCKFCPYTALCFK